jgi:hypothetical protein
MVEITNREDYDALLKRGIDCLYDKRYHLEIGLRREIQREKFGTNTIANNQKFYRFCIEHLPMVCEECGKPITHPSAINVSHILTKGSNPAMAYDCRNVNILCPEHHSVWENGDRQSMRIYDRNNERIELLKQEYYIV